MPLFSLEELASSSVQILDNLENTIFEDDLTNYDIAEIHLVPKGGTEEDKVICRNVIENGKLVLKCTKAG